MKHHLTRSSLRGRIAAATAAVAALLGIGVLPALAQPAGAAAPTCVRGTLAYSFYDAETDDRDFSATVPRARFELRDDSGVLSTGETDRRGGFAACTRRAGTGLRVWFASSAAHGTWQVIRTSVVDPGKDDLHWFGTRSIDTSHGRRVDLGVVQPPADQQGAFRIVSVLDKLYDERGHHSRCFAKVDTGRCAPLTYVWAADRETGGWWDYWGPGDAYVDPEEGGLVNTKYVVLDKTDPASQHTILHEAGHWLQWQLHRERFPEVTACNPHYINKPSSESCAWTEGFADAVAAHVLGDRRYVYSSGFSYPLHRTDCTPAEPRGCAFDGGRATQGNVGSALLDLWDAEGGWRHSFAAMATQVSPDVQAYYEHRYPFPSRRVRAIHDRWTLQETNGVR
ncbi:hypothetical protein [Nocardioides sp. LML1-1-1.1]|uniref:hypothetical protein n=1 Tax=Nocardioides sp. LML1-1-1.1 TaxID=3135248 RepID=UPI003443E853